MGADGAAGVSERPGDGGKGMWRQTPRPERQEQMLEAAMKLFAEGGYSNVSMDAIAAETGITKPLLYSYFESKEGLYVACIERFFVPLEQAIVRLGGANLPPERWLWEGALVAFRFIGSHRSGWQRFLLEPPAHGELAAAAVEALARTGGGPAGRDVRAGDPRLRPRRRRASRDPGAGPHLRGWHRGPRALVGRPPR